MQSQCISTRILSNARWIETCATRGLVVLNVFSTYVTATSTATSAAVLQWWVASRRPTWPGTVGIGLPLCCGRGSPLQHGGAGRSGGGMHRRWLAAVLRSRVTVALQANLVAPVCSFSSSLWPRLILNFVILVISVFALPKDVGGLDAHHSMILEQSLS
jgi:hypothetical protein